MTASDIIALTVGSLIAAACLYFFIAILAQGSYGASGYVCSWESNPTEMTITLICLLVCPALIIWGVASQSLPLRVGDNVHDEAYKLYIAIDDDCTPNFQYEGPGVLRELSILGDRASDVHFHFSTMSLPAGTEWDLGGKNDLPRYRIVDFNGVLSHFNGLHRLNGGLRSNGNGYLVVLVNDGTTEMNIDLKPGDNLIEVSW